MLLPEDFPQLPLDFGRAGGVKEPRRVFETALGRLALVCGLVAHSLFAFRARSAVETLCMDRLVCWLTLCGRCVIVGCLRTACVFVAFALVVSVWLVAVFSER